MNRDRSAAPLTPKPVINVSEKVLYTIARSKNELRGFVKERHRSAKSTNGVLRSNCPTIMGKITTFPAKANQINGWKNEQNERGDYARYVTVRQVNHRSRTNLIFLLEIYRVCSTAVFSPNPCRVPRIETPCPAPSIHTTSRGVRKTPIVFANIALNIAVVMSPPAACV